MSAQYEPASNRKALDGISGLDHSMGISQLPCLNLRVSGPWGVCTPHSSRALSPIWSLDGSYAVKSVVEVWACAVIADARQRRS